MKNLTISVLGAVLAVTMVGCSSVPRNTGTSYECNRGTRLKVDYTLKGAIVRVNGGQVLVLKSTPSNEGQAYENKTGVRLLRTGNVVTWNTALRTAPETCQVVNTPL